LRYSVSTGPIELGIVNHGQVETWYAEVPHPLIDGVRRDCVAAENDRRQQAALNAFLRSVESLFRGNGLHHHSRDVCEGVLAPRITVFVWPGPPGRDRNVLAKSPGELTHFRCR
jgi:hypothetical protein